MKLQLAHADNLRAQAAEASARAAEAEREAAVRQAVEEERQRSDAEKAKLLSDLDDRLQAVGSREATLNSAIKKVMHAEEAMEACLTCMSCMELLREPLTCTPCGHTFCAQCCPTGACSECAGSAVPGKPLKVEMLQTLTSKFEFQKQCLSALSVSSTTANVVSKFAALARKS